MWCVDELMAVRVAAAVPQLTRGVESDGIRSVRHIFHHIDIVDVDVEVKSLSTPNDAR